MKLKKVFVVLTLAMSLSFLSAASTYALPSQEPNDSWQTAYVIPHNIFGQMGTVYNGYISTPNDVDWFVFTAQTTTTQYTAFWPPDANNSYAIAIFDRERLENGRNSIVAEITTDGSGRLLQYNVETGKEYYILIFTLGGQGNSEQKYILSP